MHSQKSISRFFFDASVLIDLFSLQQLISASKYFTNKARKVKEKDRLLEIDYQVSADPMLG